MKKQITVENTTLEVDYNVLKLYLGVESENSCVDYLVSLAMAIENSGYSIDEEKLTEIGIKKI